MSIGLLPRLGGVCGGWSTGSEQSNRVAEFFLDRLSWVITGQAQGEAHADRRRWS